MCTLGTVDPHCRPSIGPLSTNTSVDTRSCISRLSIDISVDTRSSIDRVCMLADTVPLCRQSAEALPISKRYFADSVKVILLFVKK